MLTLLIGLLALVAASMAQDPPGFFSVPYGATYYRGRGLTSVSTLCLFKGAPGGDMGYIIGVRDDGSPYIQTVYCGTASQFPPSPALVLCPTPAPDSGRRTIVKLERVSFGLISQPQPFQEDAMCETIACSGDTCSNDHPVPLLALRYNFETLASCDPGQVFVLRTDTSISPPVVNYTCTDPEDVDPATDVIMTTSVPHAIPAAGSGRYIGNGIDAIATFACVAGYVKSADGQSCVLAPTAGPNGRSKRAQISKHASHSSNVARRTRTQKTAVEFDAFQ